ncbi:MAG: hypothetical protein RMK94_07815 [Armatimonadota bacterium]|nr:hypothetical protein [Armatimonadota bacterium]
MVKVWHRLPAYEKRKGVSLPSKFAKFAYPCSMFGFGTTYLCSVTWNEMERLFVFITSVYLMAHF